MGGRIWARLSKEEGRRTGLDIQTSAFLWRKRKMTLLEAASTCLSKYATFSGRSSREEYWKFTAVYVIALFGTLILFNVTNWAIFGYMIVVVAVGSVVPFLSVGVRRLHDTGRPATWMLIRLVPFAGDLIIFIYSVEGSQPFTNAYGASPKPGPYPSVFGAGQTPPFPEEGPLATTSPSGNESHLPPRQAHRKAVLRAADRPRYRSLESPTGIAQPRFSLPRALAKQRGLIAGGIAFALLMLGIFLGANLWRPTGPDSVQAAAPAAQPPLAPALPSDISTVQLTPSPSQTVQATVPTAVTATPEIPSQSAAPLPGDLGLTSPLRPVGCTGQFILVYHSSTDPSAYARDVQTNLESHPGSKYLLTLGSCSSLNQMSNTGTMIYAVYGGPYNTLAQACVAASQFPEEAYVKIMDSATAPDQAQRSCQ
ncbi:DUF805 domain-containing protein [Arthrobacter sp. HMWF013]|uniref:DUF805 domain-containing protein n=1 Tax=Arthrobacter sp. HMWF013 TaxID=2056849 RepID=UPI000D3437BB|nr:DUF805 domain-containing protein [Arthrobacter sp. HMWF013]PTT60823.1 hypothetical protein DBR22_19825 [Arthrobacter sp. HMWF013]